MTIDAFCLDITSAGELSDGLDPLVKSFKHTDSNRRENLIKIQNSFIDFESKIHLLVNEWSSIPTPSVAESTAIIELIRQLSEKVQVLLNDIGVSRIEFDHAILGVFSISPVIKGHLEKLQTLFTSMFADGQKVLDKSVTPSLDTIGTKLASSFDIQATVVYSQMCSVYLPVKFPLGS